MVSDTSAGARRQTEFHDRGHRFHSRTGVLHDPQIQLRTQRSIDLKGSPPIDHETGPAWPINLAPKNDKLGQRPRIG